MNPFRTETRTETRKLWTNKERTKKKSETNSERTPKELRKKLERSSKEWQKFNSEHWKNTETDTKTEPKSR